MRPRKTVAIYHPHRNTALLMRYAIEITTQTRVSIVENMKDLDISGTDGKVRWMRNWVEFMDFDGRLCQRIRLDSANFEVMEAVRLCVSRKRGPRKGVARGPYEKRSIAA